MSLFDSFLLKNSKKKDWKTIEEIATQHIRGSDVTKDQIGTGSHPCLQYGELFTVYEISFDKCVSFIDERLIKKPKYIENGDIVFADASVIPENIGKCCAYLGKEKIIIGLHTIAFKHKQNPKYLAYVLSSSESVKQKIRYSTIGTVSGISWSTFKKIKIPIPELEIQNRIVEVLDKFRSLNIELQKEIENRRKQYNYYKEFLFNLGGGV